MPALSTFMRKKKIEYFIHGIPKDAKILEVGCGSGWLRSYLKDHGWNNYTGLDIAPPADIVGNIIEWESLGIVPDSFDVVVAFEMIEHVNCLQHFYAILKPGGLLMITLPLPHTDWICMILEAVGLTQKRTSPHTQLRYCKHILPFETVNYRIIGGIVQWGIFRKPGGVRKAVRD